MPRGEERAADNQEDQEAEEVVEETRETLALGEAEAAKLTQALDRLAQMA